MTQRELMTLISDLVSEYFSGATISWTRVKGTNPNLPQVALSMGNVVRTHHSIRRTVNGVAVSYTPSKTTVQVDLYTKGEVKDAQPNVMTTAFNTAIADLTDFVSFINSDYVNNWMLNNDVAILANQVYDLTSLVSNAVWGYRAMVELVISFTQTAVGHTGTMWENGKLYGQNGKPLPEQPDFETTPSGGRSQDLADETSGWFNKVITEYVKEDEK